MNAPEQRVTVCCRETSELTLDTRNPRLHSPEQVRQIGRSIQTKGGRGARLRRLAVSCVRFDRDGIWKQSGWRVALLVVVERFSYVRKLLSRRFRASAASSGSGRLISGPMSLRTIRSTRSGFIAPRTIATAPPRELPIKLTFDTLSACYSSDA